VSKQSSGGVKAATAGYRNAQGSIGDVYSNGECGVKQDFAEAYFWHTCRGEHFNPAAAKLMPVVFRLSKLKL